jgi:hypothetical protein
MKKIIYFSFLLSLLMVCGLSFGGDVPEEKDRQLSRESGWLEVYDFAGERAGETFDVKARPKKRWGRAWLELLPMITVSQFNYWIKYSKWIEDWQFKFTWKDQKKRFFSLEALKFDSNDFQTNWTHAGAGAIYYNFARANNLTWAESFLFNTAVSLYWEYLVEWREVVSVNDNIWTALGGVPIGEALFQTSRFISRRPGVFNKIIAGLLNPILTFNQWLDRKKGIPYTGRQDEVHRFRLSAGQKQSSQTGGEADVHSHFGIDTEIIHIPGYGRAGSFSRGIKDTMSTRMHLDMTLSRQGVEELYTFTRVVLTGYAGQRLTQQGSRGLKGFSYFLGAGSGFELYKKRSVWEYDSGSYFFYADEYREIPLPTRFTDKFSTINVVGPVFDIAFFAPRTRLRLCLEAYFDFAMVNALALNDYTGIYGLVGAKATLANYGYYYGLGYNASADLDFRYRDIEVGAGIEYRYYDSIEGIDRFQDSITDDFNLVDSRLAYRFSLGYWFPHTPLGLLFTFEEFDRRGRIKEISRRRFDTRIYAQFQLNL